jgi:hypothetical protein
MASGDNPASNPLGATTLDTTGGAKTGANRQDERTAKRYPCSGRAKILTAKGRSIDGRMFDISMTGASLLLEDRIPFDAPCTITISVYKGGVLHHFQVHARFVHASLAGQTGFKHGFEFQGLDNAATQALAALTHTPPSALAAAAG